jgi:hypothetical protein
MWQAHKNGHTRYSPPRSTKRRHPRPSARAWSVSAVTRQVGSKGCFPLTEPTGLGTLEKCYCCPTEAAKAHVPTTEASSPHWTQSRGQSQTPNPRGPWQAAAPGLQTTVGQQSAPLRPAKMLATQAIVARLEASEVEASAAVDRPPPPSRPTLSQPTALVTRTAMPSSSGSGGCAQTHRCRAARLYHPSCPRLFSHLGVIVEKTQGHRLRPLANPCVMLVVPRHHPARKPRRRYTPADAASPAAPVRTTSPVPGATKSITETTRTCSLCARAVPNCDPKPALLTPPKPTCLPRAAAKKERPIAGIVSIASSVRGCVTQKSVTVSSPTTVIGGNWV